ncbi:hypothetical protein NT2_13_00820 [Caenibius tardaugens NBRC 16725]|uniref:Uncharacterized protein n=1 Tax=Caenibius tardaugens NBRC 16725 TaxID=1219035 RepID=U2YPX5_9SPHN|nr:hypothetical protein [Caenibius tardaugens]AZI37877.1 hypothetical protein EGO55_19500 [Caenibius tardaugens NBRC 16725]GAD50995.1 hypothetical protein NT2_13_00820 [Caenibius tardaugens NBRC 16725]
MSAIERHCFGSSACAGVVRQTDARKLAAKADTIFFVLAISDPAPKTTRLFDGIKLETAIID